MTDHDPADAGPGPTSPRETGGSSRRDADDLGGPLGALGGTIGPDDVTAAAAGVLAAGATDWFEPLYREAHGDPSQVPWAGLSPHPYVLGWLDQPGLDVTGVDAVVVGCGLGDDAAELARRGCRVTAFDISPTAVAWARRRFPDLDVAWEVADVRDLPTHLVGAFGLVVEVRTVQSLPATARDEAMQGIASLVGPGGWLLATTLLATSDEVASSWSGPPWAQAPAELAAYRVDGLERVALDHPPGGREREAMEVRVTFTRPDPTD